MEKQGLWTVVASKKAGKSIVDLPKKVVEALELLLDDIQLKGPIRGDWPNYSPLGKDKHHCHFQKGRPTYVACWRITDKTLKEIEVYYVGTHEKAPY